MPLLELKILEIHSFFAVFSYMLWHIAVKFYMWLCFTVLQIRFECSQFPWSIVGVMPLLELKILEILCFSQFSPTWFDILLWNFAYDFVLLYYRSSLSVVNFRQVLLELCPFWNLIYWKYTVFRSFLLHALTYCSEVLHMTLFYSITDQVWVSSISVNFWRSYAPLPLLELKIHSFLHFPPTCVDLLTWNCACHFILINIRPSSSVVNFRRFL